MSRAGRFNKAKKDDGSQYLAMGVGLRIAIGAGIGTALGVAIQNIAVGIAVGVGCGMALVVGIGSLMAGKQSGRRAKHEHIFPARILKGLGASIP